MHGLKSDADRVRLAFKLFDSGGVALLQMMEDGAYADLYRKWFSADPE